MKVLHSFAGETMSGRYRLDFRIAGGGMGEVYRGHDLLLDRVVAVKLLGPSLSAEPSVVDRFLAEARAVARLAGHPNVVAVFDWGTQRGTYYMVMEYVPGIDLRELLVMHRRLEPGQAAAVMAPVCEALQAAHSRGVVHRDVKPENVLIAKDGHIKVADFGIAVLAGADPRSGAGSIFGTPRYLSPEQARGAQAGFASDIWSAGAVLAELLTGRPPLQGAGDSLLRRRAEEPVAPPSAVAPDIPKEFDEIVLKACAIDPKARWVSAKEMATVLRLSAKPEDEASIAALLREVTREVTVTESQPPRRGFSRRAKRVRQEDPFDPLTVLQAAAGRSEPLSDAAGRGKGVSVQPRAATANVAGRSRRRSHAGEGDSSFDIQEAIPTVAGKSLRNQFSGASQQELLGREIAIPTVAGKFRRRPPGRFLAAFVVVAVAVGGVVAARVGSSPGQVVVPKLVGLTTEEADSRADAAGLDLTVLNRVSSLEGAPGEVIRQAPRDGRLPQGATLHVTVSRGPPAVVLPDLTGLSRSAARARLARHHLKPGEITHRFSLEPAGVVIGQSPVPGRIPWGSSVDLVVGKGPRPVEVPNVSGHKVKSAVAVLQRLGFEIAVDEVYSRAAPKGRVLSTSPRRGTTAPQGSIITVQVSLGPKVVMPDVRDLSVAEARSRLAKLGLRSKIVHSQGACDGEGGTVAETDPIAGSTVRPGDVAALFVC